MGQSYCKNNELDLYYNFGFLIFFNDIFRFRVKEKKLKGDLVNIVFFFPHQNGR